MWAQRCSRSGRTLSGAGEASGLQKCMNRQLRRHFRRHGCKPCRAPVNPPIVPKRAIDGHDDVRQLSALADLGRGLGGAPDLRSALERALEKLEGTQGIVRGAVFLVHAESGDIQVDAALGLTADGLRARYKAGEGIIGRVVQSGRPVIVPATGREPLLMNRAFQRRGTSIPEASFVAVPIMVDRKAVGALAADFPPAGRDLEAAAQFLAVVAAMMAQAVRAQGRIEDERNRLLTENKSLRSELEDRYDLSNIVGTSRPMRQVYQQIPQVAQTSPTALIRGESGTGKELIAHAIHYNSPRAQKPFVKVSCAALPDTLIESELFGYERGAFTGAETRKRGRFELAHGGTLFLDEVGELNLPTQVKLLRVLQEGEFERLGGTETLKADVRLITATNRNLEAALADRPVRGDLYYLLHGLSLFHPPLPLRKPRVILLAARFLINCDS